MVVRYQGGSNAGHTIKVGEEVFALHILPSGIVRKNVINVIGNGVIVDLLSLDREIADVESRGRSVAGLQDFRPGERHSQLAPASWTGRRNGSGGRKSVGTTGKGIGPCYSDKIARSGIRMGDLLDPELLGRAPGHRHAHEAQGHGDTRRAAGPEPGRAALKNCLAYGHKYGSSSPTRPSW